MGRIPQIRRRLIAALALATCAVTGHAHNSGVNNTTPGKSIMVCANGGSPAYVRQDGYGTVSDPLASCASFTQYYCDNNGGHCRADFQWYNHGSIPNDGATCAVHYGSTDSMTGSATIDMWGTCPATSCAAGEVATGRKVYDGAAMPESQICSGGCTMTRTTMLRLFTFWKGAANGVDDSHIISYAFTKTGATCGTNTTLAGAELPDGCALKADGTQFCEDTVEPGCGYVNGIKTCPGKPTPNCGEVNGVAKCVTAPDTKSCSILENGGGMCIVTGATDTTVPPPVGSPPAPDDGTAGNEAQPNGTIRGANGAQANIYNNSTVNNSSNYGTGPDGGSGDANDDGEASCGAPGQPVCKVQVEGAGNSQFTAPILPEVATYETTLSGYYARVKAAPIVASLGSLGDYIPSGVGTCPTATFDIFGTQIVMDAQCTLMENLRDVLGWMMLVCYGVIAARVLLSA